MEKIVETPRETIIIDDITDITKIKSINDRTERTTDITDVTDINRIRNTINLQETEENILHEVTKENVVVRNFVFHFIKIYMTQSIYFNYNMYIQSIIVLILLIFESKLTKERDRNSDQMFTNVVQFQLMDSIGIY